MLRAIQIIGSHSILIEDTKSILLKYKTSPSCTGKQHINEWENQYTKRLNHKLSNL